MTRSMAALALVSLGSIANAQSLNGASLNAQWYSPNLSSVFGFPSTVVVGPGVELPGYFFGIIDVDITTSQMIATFRAPNTFNPAVFNGWLLQDVTSNLAAIQSVTLNPSTTLPGFTATRIQWDPDSFGINLQGMTVATGDTVILDIVTVPGPGSAALLALGGLLAARRQR